MLECKILHALDGLALVICVLGDEDLGGDVVAEEFLVDGGEDCGDEGGYEGGGGEEGFAVCFGQVEE